MGLMQALGFKSAPMLEVDKKLMDFNTALNWVREQ